jgi:hypothetical protein
VIQNDADLMAAQARIQVIQSIRAHARRTLTPDSFLAQSKGWLQEWKKIEEDVRAYLSTPAEPEEAQPVAALSR